MIDKINRAGLKSIGIFILAQPTDNYQTCVETIEYACNLVCLLLFYFYLYPGTPFYKENIHLIDEDR